MLQFASPPSPPSMLGIIYPRHRHFRQSSPPTHIFPTHITDKISPHTPHAPANMPTNASAIHHYPSCHHTATLSSSLLAVAVTRRDRGAAAAFAHVGIAARTRMANAPACSARPAAAAPRPLRATATAVSHPFWATITVVSRLLGAAVTAVFRPLRTMITAVFRPLWATATAVTTPPLRGTTRFMGRSSVPLSSRSLLNRFLPSAPPATLFTRPLVARRVLPLFVRKSVARRVASPPPVLFFTGNLVARFCASRPPARRFTRRLV